MGYDIAFNEPAVSTDLILKHGTTESPDAGKDKVELVEFLGAVWWGGVWGQ